MMSLSDDTDDDTAQHALLRHALLEWHRASFRKEAKEALLGKLLSLLDNGFEGLAKRTASTLAADYSDYVLRDNRGSQRHARTLQGSDLWDFCVADASLRYPDFKV